MALQLQSRAGDLAHRITFQKRSFGSDVNGGATTDWVSLTTMWASIRVLSARELVAAQALNAEVTHKIVCRYRNFLSKPTEVVAMRVLFRGRVFNLHQATNTDERNYEIVMMASEGLNLG